MLTPTGAPLVMPRGALGDAPSGAYLAGRRQRPRCSSASAPASRRSSTCRCSAPRSGRSSIDLVATDDPAASRPAAPLAGQALSGTVLVGTVSHGRRPLAEPEHARPGPALGADVPRARARTADRRSRVRDHRRRAATRIAELHPSLRRHDRRRCRSTELKARLAAEDTIWSTMCVAERGDRRPAGAGERLHAAASRTIRPPACRRHRCSSTAAASRSGAARPKSASTPTRCSREIGVDAAEIAPAARAGSAGVRSPVPQPRMIWAVGLNYRDHAAETGRPLPECADAVREVAAAR